MIDYKCFVIGAFALVALAPMTAYAMEVSGNDTDIIQIEEETQQTNLPESAPEISDSDSDTVSDNNFVDNVQSSGDDGDGSEFVGSDGFDTVSDNDLDFGIESDLLDSDIIPFANYDTYYGSISSTYVEYMRGYLGKMPFGSHYVGARTGQYEYILAFGDLTFDGVFRGQDITVCRWYTRDDGDFNYGVQSDFYLDPNNYLVYTDLSDTYPALATSADYSLRQLVIVCGIAITFYTVGGFVRGTPSTFRRRRKRVL